MRRSICNTRIRWMLEYVRADLSELLMLCKIEGALKCNESWSFATYPLSGRISFGSTFHRILLTSSALFLLLSVLSKLFLSVAALQESQTSKSRCLELLWTSCQHATTVCRHLAGKHDYFDVSKLPREESQRLTQESHSLPKNNLLSCLTPNGAGCRDSFMTAYKSSRYIFKHDQNDR